MASNNGGDLFKGFILGSLFGLTLGVLFAPKSGKDTRDDLMGEGDDLMDKAKKELDKLKVDLGDLREKIGETIDRGKGIFEQAQSNEESDFEAELNSDDEDKETAKKKTTTKKRSTAKKEKES